MADNILFRNPLCFCGRCIYLYLLMWWGKIVFLSFRTSSPRQGLEERTPAVAWCVSSPCPPASGKYLRDSMRPDSLLLSLDPSRMLAHPKVIRGGLAFGCCRWGMAGKQLLAVMWHHCQRHKDKMLASCYSWATYTKKTLRNKGLLYRLMSSARRGKKYDMYMMLSAEIFINRDIFWTFSWVSAAC